MRHAPADDARGDALPRYLYDACALPEAHLRSLLKFRMGSHNLRRVVGAFTREPRDARVCRMPGCGALTLKTNCTLFLNALHLRRSAQQQLMTVWYFRMTTTCQLFSHKIRR